MSDLSAACDDILGGLLLDHDYGIPKLWPRNTPQVKKSVEEDEYYTLNTELSTLLNELMRLNRASELKSQTAEQIKQLYDESVGSEFPDQSPAEVARFLEEHTESFKTQALTNDFLAVALPILRAVYQGSLSLTDAEFTVLNNLKKLYSHYNEHPSNIRRLIREYKRAQTAAGKSAAASTRVDEFVSSKIAELVQELDELNAEYLVLENTYNNQLKAHSITPAEQKRLQRDYKVLRRRFATISVYCELLPNLILCQATNWSNDNKLMAIIEDCQDTLERLEELNGDSIDEILRTDFKKIAEQLVSPHE